MSVVSLPESLFTQPDLYFVEYKNDQALFAHMTRATYYNSLFTDKGRIQVKSNTPVILDIDVLAKALDELEINTKPVGFIFHTANCGSTLLSRALDIPGRTIGYREPYPLRQLGVEFTSLSDRNPGLNDWKKRLRVVMSLLARRYSDIETPIVKANIPVNFILPALLELLPDTRALLLYSDLERFLVSVLKSPEGKQWVFSVAQELSGALGSSVSGNRGNSIPETAATLWVAQIQKYHEAIKRFDGLKSLASDRFFECPAETIARAAEHYGVNLSSQEIDSIVCSDLFRRYSKNPRIEYNAAARKSEYRNQLKSLAPEISAGMRWGEDLLTKQNIDCNLPNQLL